MLKIIAVLVLALVPSLVLAQGKVDGWVELQGNVDSAHTVTPQLNLYAHGPLKGRVGWTLYAQTSEEWAEGLFGLTYAPAKWVEVSGSVGIETDEHPLRGLASIWFGAGRLAFLSLQENGGSGYWQRNLGTVEITSHVLVGVFQETFFGTGPYLELKAGRFSIWGTYAPREDLGLATIQFRF